MGRRRCGGKAERRVAWWVRKVFEGKLGGVDVEWVGLLVLVVGEEWRSWDRRSRSAWERSSMKLIRFCILSFGRADLVSLFLGFVFVLSSVCLEGLDIISFLYRG